MSDLLILNRSKISKIIFGIILIMPFVRYYNMPGTPISIETFCLILLFILCIALKIVTSNEERKENNSLKKSRKYFLLFSFWLILVTFFYELCTNINIANVASNYTMNTFIMLVPTIIIICTILDNRIKIDGLFSLYEKIVYLVIYVYIFQWILMILGLKIGFNLPFLKYNDSWSYLNQICFGMNKRPTSLFSEQAHMCEYIIPYLAICLYSKYYKRNILKAILVSIIIISTTSGNGIVVTCIAWICYILYFGKMNIMYRCLLIIAGIITFIGVYNLLLKIPAFNKIFSELFVNTTGKYSGTKADYRIYRGFDYYFKLPFFQKVVGVGYQHMHAFALEYGIYSKFDNTTNAFEFFSTITQVLLYSGIIGFTFFIKHLYYIWKSKTHLVKGLILLCGAIWFSSQMLFSNTYIMYLIIFIIAYLGEEEKNETVGINNSANL